MKKVICGKMYNTGTAQCLAQWHNDRFENDFDYAYKALFRKKNGEFFVKNYSHSAEEIVALSDDEAKLWVERWNNEEYENIFGAVEE
jgi:hypothetical protein